MSGDSLFVEGIKLLGGIAGLGTAAFTIYDRLARGRPLVIVEQRTFIDRPTERLQIRILNTADEHGILIRHIVPSPEVWKIARDDSTREMMLGSLDERPRTPAGEPAPATRTRPSRAPSSVRACGARSGRATT
jgi:hypothetical protein